MSEASSRSSMRLSEAAEQLGVHYQTAYKWVRDGTLPAARVGRAYRLDPDDVTAFAAARATPTAPPPRRPRIDAAERMFELLLAGDEPRARSMARELEDQGVLASQIAGELLAPALRRVGDGWKRGEISVAVEHRATAIAERALADVMPNPRGRRRGTVVVASLSGDRHGLASTMAALALREDHWNVEHIGADVPPDEIERFVDEVGADLLVLTVVFADDDRVEELAERVRGAGTTVLVGEPGATLGELQSRARGIN